MCEWVSEDRQTDRQREEERRKECMKESQEEKEGGRMGANECGKEKKGNVLWTKSRGGDNLCQKKRGVGDLMKDINKRKNIKPKEARYEAVFSFTLKPRSIN